ncbi:MAG: HD domain-containing protein [Lentisphaeria bacterium]
MSFTSAERQLWLELLPTLEMKVKELLLSMPSCHDWDHTLRVRENARKLAVAEHADLLLVDYASLLHDIGRLQEFKDQGKTCHAALGALMAVQVLEELGVCNPTFVEQITACVRTHRYRGRTAEKPASLEAKVVFDADKLDSLGAIGLARSFHFAGRIGARVHNSEEEALNSKSYSREDSAYREFLVKLRHLPAAMLTQSGRKIAGIRAGLMQDFFQKLNLECSGQDLTSFLL